jgi:hypothetical protein
MPTASSGRLVPSATTVRLTMMGLTPRCEASVAPLRTSRSAPTSSPAKPGHEEQGTRHGLMLWAVVCCGSRHVRRPRMAARARYRSSAQGTDGGREPDALGAPTACFEARAQAAAKSAAYLRWTKLDRPGRNAGFSGRDLRRSTQPGRPTGNSGLKARPPYGDSDGKNRGVCRDSFEWS